MKTKQTVMGTAPTIQERKGRCFIPSPKEHWTTWLTPMPNTICGLLQPTRGSCLFLYSPDVRALPQWERGQLQQVCLLQPRGCQESLPQAAAGGPLRARSLPATGAVPALEGVQQLLWLQPPHASSSNDSSSLQVTKGPLLG